MNSVFGAFGPAIMFSIGCFVALVSHEAAHIVIARSFGVRVKRIGISWRGPYIVRESGEPKANLFIALAGPAANILLAIFCWDAMPMFAQINLVLGLSNLLPLPASDGFRAWTALHRLELRALRSAL